MLNTIVLSTKNPATLVVGVQIEVKRYEIADKMYKNRDEMNWCEPNDRLFLVKECGWHCEYSDKNECKICVARDFCDTGIKLLDEVDRLNWEDKT